MTSISSNTHRNMQAGSSNVTAAVQATEVKPHSEPLSWAMLSNFSQDALDVRLKKPMQAGFNDGEIKVVTEEKKLALVAKEAIEKKLLNVSHHQAESGITLFEMEKCDANGEHGRLVLQTKRNENSRYTLLEVRFIRNNEKVAFMELPPPKGLLDIPLELQSDITHRLFDQSDQRKGVYDVSALKRSARSLRATIDGDSLLKPRYEIRKKVIGAVNTLPVNELSDFSDTALLKLASHDKIEKCLDAWVNKINGGISVPFIGESLEVLKPEQHTCLVEAILNFVSDESRDVNGNGDWNKWGDMVGGLGEGLHAIPGHHDEIINTVLKMDDRDKGWAIAGLGKGLHTLTPALRNKLFDAVMGSEDQTVLPMEDAVDWCNVIDGLVKGMHALTEKQHNRLVEAALEFNDEDNFSEYLVPALCGKLQVLTPKQQNGLAEAVSSLEDDKALIFALKGLGKALKNVSGLHYTDMLEILSERVLSIPKEEDKAKALNCLGAGLAPVSKDEGFDHEKHEQLVTQVFNATMAIKEESCKSRAIIGWGNGFSAFSPEQREKLVNACLDMKDESNKSHAMHGLGAGLQALTPEQQERLVDACVNMENGNNKSIAIYGLGVTVKALASEQQERLVEAAINMMDIASRAFAIRGLMDVENAQQYDCLVNAAISLPQSAESPDNNESTGLLSPQAHTLVYLMKAQRF